MVQTQNGRRPATYSGQNVEPEDFSGLALGAYFERATTNLAVGRKRLKLDAGVYHHLENLPAERANDLPGDFHCTAC